MERIDYDDVLKLDEHHLAELCDDGLGGTQYAIRKTWDEFRKWEREHNNVIHVAALVTRPGVELWLTEMERTYYWPPGSPVNDLFTLHSFPWAGLQWILATIPKKHERFAVRRAGRIGLEVRHSTPMAIGDPPVTIIGSTRHYDRPPSRGGRYFPVAGERVRTLEFLPGHALAGAANAGLARVLKEFEHGVIEMGAASARNAHKEN